MSNGSPSMSHCDDIRLNGRKLTRRAKGLEVVDQRVEVMLLAEEGREVGGQAVHELLPLRLAGGPRGALQPLQVVREAAVAGLAQAARQAAVHHGLLARVQADARAL